MVQPYFCHSYSGTDLSHSDFSLHPPPLLPGGGNVFRSTTAAQAPFNVGLVGARGYVGAELIRLVSDHPSMTLKVASSRALEGQNISTIIDKQKRYGGASSWTAVPSDQGGLDEELAFVNIGPADAASPLYEDIDLWFLALPNGLAEPFVKALVDDDEGGTGQKKKVIVDLVSRSRQFSTSCRSCRQLECSFILVHKVHTVFSSFKFQYCCSCVFSVQSNFY